MSNSLPASGHGSLRSIAFLILGLLVALAPLHTKILGAAWLGFFVWGIASATGARGATRNDNQASASWLAACIAALILAGVCALIWDESSNILNPQIRLLIPALSVYLVLRKGYLAPQARIYMLHAIALAGMTAFIWTVYLSLSGQDVRSSLASNAIPWAVASSFYACLLLPAALAERQSMLRRRLWLASVACVVLAVLLSRSLGAFMLIPWCVLVCIWFWYRHRVRNTSSLPILALVVSAIIFLLACAWWAPADILKLRKTTQEISETRATHNYNTSAGARLYMWNLAWQGFQQSPWIGVGSAERIRRLKQAGENDADPNRLAAVRSLGHVHNQYLNAALDGGLLGLASLLTVLGGMALATRRLAQTDKVAAWQMGGVLLMHASASMSNVNSLHNYYMMALSLAAVVPLLGAAYAPEKRPS
jgi:O-antigen ligase